MPTKDEAEHSAAVEAKILRNLLTTPPQPKVSPGSGAKRRGRPPKKKPANQATNGGDASKDRV